jgi:hypothetical protein
MEYICNICGKRKGSAQDWRVGLETTAPAGSDIEKTIVVIHAWDEQRAHEPTAIHFCSQKCEEEYLSVWYGERELAAA